MLKKSKRESGEELHYISRYPSPIGEILLVADEIGLTGLWLEGQKHLPLSAYQEEETTHILAAKQWLDLYFSGQEPNYTVPLHPMGTPFQMEVWEILSTIPYGQTMTYGEIAGQIAARRGMSKMSAQAVGGAVGRNKISILIPCHRVIGSDGSLTGYAGGLDKKVKLLEIEGIDLSGR